MKKIVSVEIPKRQLLTNLIAFSNLLWRGCCINFRWPWDEKLSFATFCNLVCNVWQKFCVCIDLWHISQCLYVLQNHSCESLHLRKRFNWKNLWQKNKTMFHQYKFIWSLYSVETGKGRFYLWQRLEKKQSCKVEKDFPLVFGLRWPLLISITYLGEILLDYLYLGDQYQDITAPMIVLHILLYTPGLILSFYKNMTSVLAL